MGGGGGVLVLLLLLMMIKVLCCCKQQCGRLQTHDIASYTREGHARVLIRCVRRS